MENSGDANKKSKNNKKKQRRKKNNISSDTNCEAKSEPSSISSPTNQGSASSALTAVEPDEIAMKPDENHVATNEVTSKKSRKRSRKKQSVVVALQKENSTQSKPEAKGKRTKFEPSVEDKNNPLPSLTSLQLGSDPQKKPSLSRKNAGTNWSSVLAVVNADQPKEVATPNENGKVIDPSAVSKNARRKRKRQPTAIVAMDCEMVGTGPTGDDNMLARVSVVNKNGDVLLDKFVKPREPVTDYRTSVSGIRPHDIEHAEEFDDVQDEVVELLQGKKLVGHEIRKDLAVLQIKHPYVNIRDTARYKPLARLVSHGRTPSLKLLSHVILGVEIQTGEHNSVEDARAAMNVYKRLSADWEKYIAKHLKS